MNATLSTRQIRLVGLLVLVVLAAGAYMVTRHKSTTPTTTPAASTPATTTPATTTPAQTTPTNKAHSHQSTPTTLHTHGLPVSVALALRKHSVVVVSVTTPRGQDDAFERAEAQAGAKTAGVGYVAVDVFHQRSGTAILRKLGIVDTPEILVVTRRGAIQSEFKGFVDRDVVAQAAADAR